MFELRELLGRVRTANQHNICLGTPLDTLSITPIHTPTRRDLFQSLDLIPKALLDTLM
jgi:hypothetical protein